MASEEIRFIDTDSISNAYNEEKISFRAIVLSHLKKIAIYNSVEFRGGYHDENVIMIGNAISKHKVYIPDTREIYSNSIEYLSDVLFPYFDKQMLEEESKVNDELLRIFNSKTVIVEKVRDDQSDKDIEEYEREFKDVADRVSYRSERARVYRKLFRGLCSFLYRIKYLEGSVFEEEA